MWKAACQNWSSPSSPSSNLPKNILWKSNKAKYWGISMSEQVEPLPQSETQLIVRPDDSIPVRAEPLAPVRPELGETIDMTTSHLTNPAKDAGEVIGYSHSTKLSAEELLAGHPKDDSQVAGYGRAPARRHNDVISAARAVCSGSAASETLG